jgi:hypothetical protein
LIIFRVETEKIVLLSKAKQQKTQRNFCFDFSRKTTKQVFPLKRNKKQKEKKTQKYNLFLSVLLFVWQKNNNNLLLLLSNNKKKRKSFRNVLERFFCVFETTTTTTTTIYQQSITIINRQQ